MSVESSDTQRVSHLYLEHHDWLRNWFRHRLSCSEQAAELAQDVFVRLLASRRAAELQEPRAYLSRMAHGMLVDRYRRQTLEQAYLQTLADLPEPVEISAEQRVLILETLQQIDSLLNSLEPRARQIFLLAQFEELSLSEIARRLQVSVPTVRKHLIRTLTQCLLLMAD